MAASTLSNTAAWLSAPKAQFEVKPAPLGTPRENQILVRNHAIAINPIDAKIHQGAPYPVTFPAILGEDVAGEVVAVGSNVTRFRPGDRVAGAAAGFFTKRPEETAFQTYTVLEANVSCRLPHSLSYEQAVIFPLGLSTAAAALFGADLLDLRLPTYPARQPTGGKEEVLLVWGGASSVGLNAIQLAVAAGYEVLTTCSPANFPLVERLGASRAFDYRSPTVVADLVAAVRQGKGRTSVGAFDAVGGHAACVEFVRRAAEGGGVKFVATAVRGFVEPAPGEGVRIRQCQSLTIKDNHIGQAVWEDYLPQALEGGGFVPAPEPRVVGRGLEAVQAAVELKARGVSAREKVVVVL
ncbi:chaperonin 10-like protein [Coniochaeta sp. 2T2.1]|nr:chaperonin 10-like protein [Coniochaeta sp. 2T2.1]